MSFLFSMKTIVHRNHISRCISLFCAGLLAVALAACQTTPSAPIQASGAPPPAQTPTPPPAPAPAAERPTIRVKAGAEKDLKDSKGVVWKADTGFDGGMTIDRPELKVSGTDTPEIYRSERYSMQSWSAKAANGNYVLKLHFSEDYDGIPDENGRIFNYTVKDGDAATGSVAKEVKGFGPWKAAGARYKAYVDTAPVNLTKGQITVVFTPVMQNPQINAIELLPQ
jgi:hypothetical protein